MKDKRKPTGCFARNGEIYVGDSIHYDDGWLSFVAKIEERDGKFGYHLQDDLEFYHDNDEFTVLKEDILLFEEDALNEDIEILHPDHHEWYGIHSPLYGGAVQAYDALEERRKNDMEKQYFRLRLWDYSTPSFVSKSKAFYGTLADIRSFIGALEADEKTKKDFQETIAAFREFEAGNHAVTHNIAYQEIPLLEPVRIWFEAMLRLDNYSWSHKNTWDCDYSMRCRNVVMQHLWIETPDGFQRVVKAHFKNLQYRGEGRETWSNFNIPFWGHPKILHVDGESIFNRLAVEEKSFENRDAAAHNYVQFYEEKDVDLTEFCNEIFGDG